MKSKLSIILVAVCLSTGCTGPISERHHEEPPALLYSLDNKDRLIQMAEKRFGKLTEADKILFAAVADGNWADYTEGEDKDKIEKADKWGEGRIIKANRIKWLCSDKQAKELVTNKGILVGGAKIEGEVDLSFAEISFPLGFFRCVLTEEINIQYSKIKFLNLCGSHTGSIRADGVKVESGVYLRDGFKANGEVRFPEATIGGDFDCEEGEFINENGRAIFADGMDVKGGVFLRNGFKAEGEIRFSGATIGGSFDCTNGKFINKDGKAISADRMDVKGNVFLRDGFRVNGEVRFPRATIGGDFDCVKGEFINEDGIAILADRMVVKGYVFLRNGFKAEGEVNFIGAAIGGNFECDRGEFINKDGRAIFADGIDVKGNVFLRDGFKAEGKVSLVGATVGGFIWSDVELMDKTELDLRNAKAGTLWDDVKSWPKKGNLFLDGFVYENIYDKAPKDAKSRIEWLNRQSEERFRPGPYEQLAKVLEKIGHSEDAKKILIEKEKKITELNRSSWRRFWRDVLEVTIRYGYRPWRALWFIGAFILIGFIVFGSGYKSGVIVPMEKDAYVSVQGRQLREGYPRFGVLACLVYSIDMFVPVVDLRMAKYWMPDANKTGKLWFIPIRGYLVRLYMWVHICAGWILTTLLVVGLTGLVKK